MDMPSVRQKIQVYFARATTEDGRVYKLSRGRVKQMHEARGEDTFLSRFEAVHAVSRAMKDWQFTPITLVFNIDWREVFEDEVL